MSRLHGTACQRQCGSFATKLSRLDACKDRLFAGVGRRHPVTIRKASLMAGQRGRCVAGKFYLLQLVAVQWARPGSVIYCTTGVVHSPANSTKHYLQKARL